MEVTDEPNMGAITSALFQFSKAPAFSFDRK